MNKNITFKALKEEHFSLLLKWVETHHIKKWWDADINWTPELIEKKYSNYVKGFKRLKSKTQIIEKPMHAFIINCDGVDIGYIQYYNKHDFPPEQVYNTLELPESCAAIDWYIGELNYVGKGVGLLRTVKSWRLKRGYTQKDLAGKIGVTYQIVLQYEKGTRKISIEKLYAIAEVLSIGIVDLIPASNEKICLEDEGEEILNLVREYKKINDQELRKIFCLLTKFVQISEKSSKKAEKIKIAKGLVKGGVSVDIVAKTIGLSADECVEEKGGSIYCQIGKKIKEWRAVREYTQKDLAEKMVTTRDEISNYEQGRVAVPLDKLYEIAKALSINIMDLLELTEDADDKVVPDLFNHYGLKSKD